MKLSPKQKKWTTIFGILFILGLLFGGILYYFVVKEFKQIIQIAVSKESNGLYYFDADRVKLNLFKRSIRIKNAAFNCTDTTQVKLYHQLNITDVYLRIHSFRDLIFDKKLYIDSLNINLPRLSTHDVVSDESIDNNISFHAYSVYEMLQELATSLEVRYLNIQDGTYTYTNNKINRPFTCTHIFLRINNFSGKEGRSTRLFSSDDLDISLYNQHWKLPDGIHDIDFKRVHFSGKNQFFKLDTCSFHKASEAGKNEITLSANQFYFNSKRLTAIHEKEELLIDTLICYRPVLSFIPANKKQMPADSIASVSQFIKGLFKKINFKYIDIREGAISLAANNNYDTFTTSKTNLKIYNLSITPLSEPHVTSDSIKLDLNKILFYTKDSLNQLSIDEFKLYNNDIIFKNAEFGPTPGNKSGKAISFTTASLLLKDINLEALVKKKIIANQAYLYDPVITMIYKGKEKRRNESDKKTVQFFETLHDVSELIQVQDFNILHGNLHYTLEGAAPLKMEMKNMNVHILLTNFLKSEALVDIKRSVATLQVAELSMKTPGLKLTIHGYNYVGNTLHNQANNFLLTLHGASVRGNQLNWESLDWDQYIYHRKIKVETLVAKELSINLEARVHLETNRPTIKLPPLDIHRLEIEHLNFNSLHPNSNILFTAANIGISNIASENNFLIWQNAHATMRNLAYNNRNMRVNINKIIFANDETILYATYLANNIDRGNTLVMVPEFKIKAAFNSTDFSLLHPTLLEATKPTIAIFRSPARENTSTPTIFKIPDYLKADKFIVKEATINQLTIKEKDSTTISMKATVDISDLQTNNQSMSSVKFSNAAIDLADVQYNNKKVFLIIPKMSGALSNSTVIKNINYQLSFNAVLIAKWLNASIKMGMPGDAKLVAESIDGKFEADSFLIQSQKKIAWQQLLAQTNLKGGTAYYKNKNITAKAGSFGWDPILNACYARKYSIVPNLDEATTFSKAKWQADYIFVEGDAISISSHQFSKVPKDSIIHIEKIGIDNSFLQATRDRHIPFRHNIEKLMPGPLIHSIKQRIQVDSIAVNNSTISVNEIVEKTNKKATIPITHLNAIITNLSNTNKDSLSINARAIALNNQVTNFSYKEATNDSLSYFKASLSASPMKLSNLSDVTIPMASVRIKKGNSDTLFAEWAGNKHAAIGNMNFYYKGLKIQLLDKDDPEKNNLFLSIAGDLSDIILHNKNYKPARIFFIRDKEKFVFNYWVKALASGALTSAGVRKNRQFIKQYKAVKEAYRLPELK